MKLWLDDLRVPPDTSWTWVKTAQEALDLLRKRIPDEISFDHDLGESDQTGYTVAREIEARCWTGQPGHNRRIKWHIHSANPVGRANIQAAMESCDRYWRGYDHEGTGC